MRLMRASFIPLFHSGDSRLSKYYSYYYSFNLTKIRKSTGNIFNKSLPDEHGIEYVL